jgi:cytochrome c553
MKPIVKRVLIGVGGLLSVVVIGAGAFVGYNVHRYNSSMDQVYDVPVPAIQRSTDPVVLARGKHLAESVAACATGDCHGESLGGGKTIEAGPVGTFTGPNVSEGGLGIAYSDGELFRLVRHGIKKDGRSLRFMPAHEIGWLPDDDITAMISYVRTVPPSSKENGPMQIGLLAKVLDRFDMFVLDVARRIDHDKPELGPPPSPTAAYGRFLAKGCMGCHGETFGGGPIPGAPPEMPVPLNLTPDTTGLAGWKYEDFTRLLDTGIRKNGKKLDPFMPLAAYSKLDDTERKALWAYIETLPPRPFGSR